MATPFDDGGRLDLDGATTLARWLADHGSDGLVVAGTTGESPVLADSEKLDLWRAVAEAVTVPVIAGSGTNDTAHSIELTRAAAAAGVTGILAVTPYYSRPSQAGLFGHFSAVAEASELPVLVYDIPVRTGRKVAHETLVRLSREVRGIVGVKDAAGDPAASARLVAEAAPGFELYSGDDSLTLPLLSIGAVGLIGVATHWAGALFGEMIDAYFAGDPDGARRSNRALLESFAFESSELTPNPMPAKAMLRVMGLPAGQCRLPLGDAPDGLEARALDVLGKLERAPGGAARVG
jgi:4-hydroxy-tetrahydrodipicolinate synthase